jgi:hypothetical protein
LVRGTGQARFTRWVDRAQTQRMITANIQLSPEFGETGEEVTNAAPTPDELTHESERSSRHFNASESVSARERRYTRGLWFCEAEVARVFRDVVGRCRLRERG